MAYVLRCRDTGADCDWEGRADTEEELFRMAAKHGKEAHGMEPSPEMAEAMRKMVRRE